MIVLQNQSFEAMLHLLKMSLVNASSVDVGEWHAQSTRGNPLLVTKEVEDVILELSLPPTQSGLAATCQPNLPWAEDHFLERVSGKPFNPPPSHSQWPWSHSQHQNEGVGEFSHTYPERYWPKFANFPGRRPNGREVFVPHNGIRYEYGDLADLVSLLRKSGNTRQAYLPVWFPEDTGAVHGERVPCSLGYHFLVRGGRLSCRYYLRSCDYVRHFRDDIYLTGRLMQWIVEQIPGAVIGKLNVYISSLHIMTGDEKMIRKELENGRDHKMPSMR